MNHLGTRDGRNGMYGGIMAPDVASLPLEEALFLERLVFFYEQNLIEIRAFANREGRSYEEVSPAYK